MKICENQNKIVVRPTLIVGLGGTGGLICSYAEHFIRSLFNNVLPPFIRFLKLDTDDAEEGGPADTAHSDFINLFHHMDLGEVIRDFSAYPGLHPHLSWLKGMKLDRSFADHGCQGIPALGRVVFAELRESVIHEAVAARFSSLRESTNNVVLTGDMAQFDIAADGAPAVHIASSVCGGTGAGLLVDMAYNLRWWSREFFPRAAEIVGHLMLPEAFGTDPELRLKLDANAVATLEQIEYLTDSRRERDVLVRYRGGIKHFDALTAPFSFIYLINGHGDAGSSHRAHLVQMISQAIRAMTVEPMAQHVISDANNKLNDVLGLRDGVNGRCRCFASYGLHHGTPGHRGADIDSLLRKHLIGLYPHFAAAPPAYLQSVGEIIGRHLPASIADGPGGNDLDDFVWSRGNIPERKNLLEWFETDLKKYLDDLLSRSRREQGGRQSSTVQPTDAIRAEITQMITERIFTGRQPEDLWHVGACLDRCCDELAARFVALSREAIPRAEDIVDSIRAHALAKMDAMLGDTPENITANDIQRLVRDIMKDSDKKPWPALKKAVAHQYLAEQLQQARRALELQRDALNRLVDCATHQYPGDRSASIDAVAGRGASAQAEEDTVFSRPLYVSDDPTEKDGILRSDFRQNLVYPVLRHVVLDIDGSQQNAANPTEVSRRLKEAVGKLARQKDEFLTQVHDGTVREFHKALSAGTDPSEHPFFDAINQIYRLAVPKIDLLRTRSLAEPFEVGICQQVRTTCVPQLLGHLFATRLRNAFVSPEFERDRKVWLRLLRLRYGFCLEALTSYLDYRRAFHVYRRRRGFAPENLWLDPAWYHDYQRLRGTWQSDTSAFDDGMDSTNYDRLAAHLATCRMCAESIIEAMRQAASAITAGTAAVEAGRRIEKTKSDVTAILDRLSPSKPEEIDRGWAACNQLLSDLIEHVGKVVPPHRQQSIHACRNHWSSVLRPPCCSVEQDTPREAAAAENDGGK